MAGWLAIVNPNAGMARRAGFQARWIPRIGRAAHAIVHTDSPGSATRLASAAAHFDGLAVVGGDGTVLETLAGMERPRQHLAVVPAGRGNSLARDLGVGTMNAAVAALSAGRPRCIDLIEVEIESLGGATQTVRAASTMAVGYVAAVAARARRFTWSGRQAYALAAALNRPRRNDLVVGLDDKPAQLLSATGVILNNTRHLANFPAFPGAVLDDGRMDLMVLDAGWLAQNLHNLTLLSGLRLQARRPPEISVGRVRLGMARPSTVLIDGEQFRDVVGLTARCAPRAVSCWTPARP